MIVFVGNKSEVHVIFAITLGILLALIIKVASFKKNGKTPRDILNNYLPDMKDQEDFLLWAFGERWKDIYMTNVPKLWNERHSELILEAYGNPWEDIPKMVDLWLKVKKV